MPELRELLDVYVKKRGQYLPVYYFDNGGDLEDPSFRVVHNNTGTLSLLWTADFGATFNVNWGDGNVEAFSNNISHDYSLSGEGPFTITLEGDQSEINKIRKFETPFNDTTITEISLANLNGLRNLDIFECNNLTTYENVGSGHTEACDVLIAHCDLLAGVLDLSNFFEITGKFNMSQNPLVTNIIAPSKTISNSITNFKYEGLAGEGFTPNIDIDISNFTNLSNTVHFAIHTSVNSLTLPTTWGGTLATLDLQDLGGISGVLDLSNVNVDVGNLYVYNNPNLTSIDFRNITWRSFSTDLWMQNDTSLTSFEIDAGEVEDIRVSSCGFTSFVIPFGTLLVFKNNCEMANLSLDQLAVDTIVNNVWDNRTKWSVPAYTPTWNFINTTTPTGTFDGVTDWSGGVPTSPQAKLWDLDNNFGFNIQNNV